MESNGCEVYTDNESGKLQMETTVVGLKRRTTVVGSELQTENDSWWATDANNTSGLDI